RSWPGRLLRLRAAVMIDLLARLIDVRASGDGWTARCPGHDDQHNSLSVKHCDGRWLLKCHAGCDWRTIVDALAIDAADLFDTAGRGGGANIPPKQPRNCATGIDPAGIRDGKEAADRVPQGLRAIGDHL